MTVKQCLNLEVKTTRALNHDTSLVTFSVDAGLAAGCAPGQFFNLRPLESSAPLLRRPISICDARPDPGEMDFLVKRVGEGTTLLTSQLDGARIDAIGPLGTTFAFDPARRTILVAGGVGVAPMYFLAKRIREAAGVGGAGIVFCYGARTERDFVLLDRIGSVASDLVLATEDGSRGLKGYVTSLLDPLLAPNAQVMTCGPSPMMNVVLQMLHAKGMIGQLSLENRMGCGVGACQGCVVPGRRGMIRVCCDGPVVSSDDLEFVFSD